MWLSSVCNFLLGNIQAENQLEKEIKGDEEVKTETHKPEVVERELSTDNPFADDIQALRQHFGSKLVGGKTLDLSLQEALQIMPRKRQRADAYNKLAKHLLEKYNVKLKIYSRKSWRKRPLIC